MFSFHATKFFNSFEGGAIATNDDALAERLRLMRNFGFKGYDNVEHDGTNGKMTEAAAAIGRGIGKPDLRYEQFPYDRVQQLMTQMGIPPKTAAEYIELYKAINAGVLAAEEPRSRENSTPTSFEAFVQDVFAPAYHGKAPTA